MTIVAYARVSSTGQSLDVQLEKLGALKPSKVFQEKLSGVDRDRPELTRAIEYCREGDIFVVTKIDRLARSTRDLLNIIHELSAKGVEFKVLDQSIDTTTPTGKLTLGILASVAEFENNIRKERQADGIAKARKDGKQLGRHPKMTDETVVTIRVLRSKGVMIKDIMKNVGMSKASVYRALAEPT
ncbi:recombinase family protein [Phyllobacterium chamaecytisi]|uniref:recombinase family protein n=1 Tax=Phyllobacterium chamaecytisi TaxID=2876082 RepID=UPI001CCAA169|nr:recombinase family protein [Phyllobacterium sp. KW56]MBZ9602609.1 recombinase family protein [Phyllobacterium sp. KW56]